MYCFDFPLECHHDVVPNSNRAIRTTQEPQDAARPNSEKAMLLTSLHNNPRHPTGNHRCCYRHRRSHPRRNSRQSMYQRMLPPLLWSVRSRPYLGPMPNRLLSLSPAPAWFLSCGACFLLFSFEVILCFVFSSVAVSLLLHVKQLLVFLCLFFDYYFFFAHNNSASVNATKPVTEGSEIG